LIGTVAGFLVTPLSGRLPDISFVSYMLLEAAYFACVGLLACASAPMRPFRSTILAFVGVVIGIVLEIVVHPTLETGSQRNLFPLEIAFHLLIAAPSILLAAAIWKAGTSTRKHPEKDA
jgi:hypothetical protein